MNRDKNGRFTKVSKELSIGDKITSFDQLKGGMIIDFVADGVNVKNAILVFDDVYYGWCAVHNNRNVNGFSPSGFKDIQSRYGVKYSWALRRSDSGENFGADYSDIIFRGWYKPEDKPEAKEEIKSEVKNPYKIGDFVKDHFDGVKSEVIGVYEHVVWIKAENFVPFRQRGFTAISPWVEPIKLKYKKGDLVEMKPSEGGVIWEIHEVTDRGYVMKNIINDGIFNGSYTDSDILRKIGVIVKE